MAKFTAYFGKHLPDDVLAKLKEMRTKQDTPLAKVMYDSMFTDLELADKFNVPFCQDTGGDEQVLRPAFDGILRQRVSRGQGRLWGKSPGPESRGRPEGPGL